MTIVSIPTTGEARKIGDALIFIEIDEDRQEERAWYKGVVIARGEIWEFSDLGAPPNWDLAWDSDEAYDEMAASAISFGSYYSSYNRGNDVPKWAPPAHIADAIEAETSWAQDDRRIYEIERINEYLENPATFTAKGERMYDSIMEGYLQKGIREPEAKRIAAATVYARSANVPGLVESQYQRNPEEDGFTMSHNPALTTAGRKKLKPRQFAVPELRKLPIEDAGHVRNAMARFNQVKGLSRDQKEKAYNRIVNAAIHHGIDATHFIERYTRYA